MSSPSDNNEETSYNVKKNDVLHSTTTGYKVLDFNGEGSFGKVAKCLNLRTGKEVAVKILKDRTNISESEREVEMLKTIRTLDLDKSNIVNFIEDFRFHNLSCLAFEMLDKSLWDLMEERSFSPLTLNEMRPVIQQLMVAFDALKSIGILHTDLKPDNIMLVNHQDQPFRIKLIDFGLARRVSQVRPGTIMQPSSYRAPEVTLGAPLTEAIDMWGLGCCMAFLYFGGVQFSSECPYDLMRTIVRLLGQPPDHVLNAGGYTYAYFKEIGEHDNPKWRFMLPNEFQDETGIEPELTFAFWDFVQNLEDAVMKYPTNVKGIEYADRMAFLSLLKSALDVDPERRITPRDSLRNPFLTMVHLKNERGTNSYYDEALQYMSILPLNHQDGHSTGQDLLTVDKEELHINNEEKLTKELQEEREKNELLREDLQRLRCSYKNIILRYEEQILEIQNQANAFQCNLVKEVFERRRLQNKFDEAITVLQEEKEKNQALQIQLEKANMSLVEADKNNKRLQEELDLHSISCQQLIARYDSDIARITKQVDALQHDLDNEILQKNRLQCEFNEAAAALQENRDECRTLKNTLDRTTVSLLEVNQKYQTDITGVRQQVDTLRSDLESELEQKKLLQIMYEDLKDTYRESLELFSAQLHAEEEKNRTLRHELDEIKNVTQQTDTLQHEPDKEIKSHADTALHNLRAEQEAEEICVSLKGDNCEDEETISPAPVLESQQSAEGNPPERTTEPPSFWKRTRHFLGLRKPKRWKRRREEQQDEG